VLQDQPTLLNTFPAFHSRTSHAPNKHTIPITKTSIITTMAYHYHSDDSTFHDSRKPRHRHHSSASDASYARSARYGKRRNTSAPHQEEKHNPASTIGKVALGVLESDLV
jgi:hypothetical protein